MTERQRGESENFQTEVRRINADNGIIPHLKRNESFKMTVAPFQDHGRPCYVGSAIRSNPLFLELARNLSPNESRIANERFNAEVERILDGGEARRVGTLSSKEGNKPVIHKLLIGESFDLKAIMLYYTRGEFMGEPAVYLLAIAKTKDSEKVERIFAANGYQGSKNWEKRKIH